MRRCPESSTMDSSKKRVFTPDEPGALVLDEVLKQVAQDDQEEWEYEYSTTETETYYLALDLSYPEFKERTAKVAHHSRGGYYKNWLDQTAAGPSVQITREQSNRGNGFGDDESNDEAEAEGENDAEDDDGGRDDEMPVDPQLRADKGKGVDTGDRAPDTSKSKGREGSKGHDGGEDENAEEDSIQILDLHSRNPVISYRGRVFEGEWAEVIGTETILAKHDKSRPLPALRNLPDDIDILGACSSRIMTTEKVPKPKAPEEDELAAIREEWNIRIPPGKDKSGERAHQIRFLENLIALKKKRGDQDQVTVYAVDGEGKDWNDRKGPDYKPRTRRKPLKAEGDIQEDDNGQESTRKRGRRRESGSRGARASRRGRAGSRSTGNTHGTSVLSTPTPSHWDSLSQTEDRGDLEEPEEEGEDEGAGGNDNENDNETEDVSMAGYD
ncbi:transcription factor TFIIIC, tau55-related protein [Purpureocillium lavendulum]|uniref:Transcription factor TFIIIC, tau55-related protein n=1 Tax=Purpureocillium lavendulum TaxID=1247861 RepID=A0AB34FNH5_9HYPO|nr:transcription factor TFIIIC, tau55-related protein [Purpureocillium lavendulum]